MRMEMMIKVVVMVVAPLLIVSWLKKSASNVDCRIVYSQGRLKRFETSSLTSMDVVNISDIVISLMHSNMMILIGFQKTFGKR
jgi:hypothetical protein